MRIYIFFSPFLARQRSKVWKFANVGNGYATAQKIDCRKKILCKAEYRQKMQENINWARGGFKLHAVADKIALNHYIARSRGYLHCNICACYRWNETHEFLKWMNENNFFPYQRCEKKNSRAARIDCGNVKAAMSKLSGEAHTDRSIYFSPMSLRTYTLSCVKICVKVALILAERFPEDFREYLACDRAKRFSPSNLVRRCVRSLCVDTRTATHN